jgi:hypothetical protein
MRALVAGDVHPYIFHMSWTFNKAVKLKYLQQLGEWFLEDRCIQKTVQEMLPGSTNTTDLQPRCCSAKAIVTCHYRDKPSIIPCHGSPAVEKGKPSWWPTTTNDK